MEDDRGKLSLLYEMVGEVASRKLNTRERWVAAVLGVNGGKKEGRCIIAQRLGYAAGGDG